MTRTDLMTVKAPFAVRNIRDGRLATVAEFSLNDPHGVCDGLVPAEPTVFFADGNSCPMPELLDQWVLAPREH